MKKLKSTIIFTSLLFFFCCLPLFAADLQITKTSVQGIYQQITPQEAQKMLKKQQNIVIVDVRRPEEYQAGHLENALLLPDYLLSRSLPRLVPDKKTIILVYCRSGRRSKNAALQMIKMGYFNVYDLGGIINWPFKIVR